MRKKIHDFLTKPTVVVLTILISAALSFFTGGGGYIIGIPVALIVFWGNKFKLIEFGIGKPDWLKTMYKAVISAILIFIIVDIIIQPFIETYLGSIDLSPLEGIRGNLINYLAFILFMWIVAAFGEEFLYRGFFMKQLAEILGDTNKSWLISAITISILFGIGHKYQGISGMITTGFVGFFLSIIFYKERTNLTLCILTHGFYDMIGITLIYLNKDQLILDLVLQHLNKN